MAKISRIIEVDDYHDIDLFADKLGVRGEELGFCCFSGSPYIGKLGKFTKAELKEALKKHKTHKYDEEYDEYCDIYYEFFATAKEKVDAN